MSYAESEPHADLELYCQHMACDKGCLWQVKAKSLKCFATPHQPYFFQFAPIHFFFYQITFFMPNVKSLGISILSPLYSFISPFEIL